SAAKRDLAADDQLLAVIAIAADRALFTRAAAVIARPAHDFRARHARAHRRGHRAHGLWRDRLHRQGGFGGAVRRHGLRLVFATLFAQRRTSSVRGTGTVPQP